VNVIAKTTFDHRIWDLYKQVLKKPTYVMYRESEKNIELEKKILELKAELKNEQEKAEILSKMLELAKINPSGLANLIDDMPAKD
jgi:hypothetical protein